VFTNVCPSVACRRPQHQLRTRSETVHSGDSDEPTIHCATRVSYRPPSPRKAQLLYATGVIQSHRNVPEPNDDAIDFCWGDDARYAIYHGRPVCRTLFSSFIDGASFQKNLDPELLQEVQNPQAKRVGVEQITAEISGDIKPKQK
jgi:hypothetical protein